MDNSEKVAPIVVDGVKEEEDEVLTRVMKDIEQFKRIEIEFQEEERLASENNMNVLRDVERYQEGRDDNQNELEQFVY